MRFGHAPIHGRGSLINPSARRHFRCGLRASFVKLSGSRLCATQLAAILLKVKKNYMLYGKVRFSLGLTLTHTMRDQNVKHLFCSCDLGERTVQTLYLILVYSQHRWKF